MSSDQYRDLPPSRRLARRESRRALAGRLERAATIAGAVLVAFAYAYLLVHILVDVAP